MKQIYSVEGNTKRGFAVVDHHGAIEYDLLESRKEATQIKNVLNSGIGPEWDAVSQELRARKERCS